MAKKDHRRNRYVLCGCIKLMRLSPPPSPLGRNVRKGRNWTYKCWRRSVWQ